MAYNLEELISTLLHKSELLEEEMKLQSDLKILTARQLTCIELINEMKNPTLTELAQNLQITKPSASLMLDRLHENGYTIRAKSDSDRRSAHVHLTEKGEKAAQLHTELHRRIASLLTQGLSESEKEILVVLLNKAVHSMKIAQK
ncbi:MAG: hypothetical protein CVU11_14515 [Bacteroidetes bacterium HGW-Bacteroidetes-6]|jgi:DNA-binding MarR family transcriptional regulator|nr:MAG: hypothetical protein CVU11_14515 [Bacteroidetes bacterium HGW-Bacteroidetes-6]